MHDHASSLDELKIYLHYDNAYDDETWQDGYIQWEAFFHKVTRSFVNVVL